MLAACTPVQASHGHGIFRPPSSFDALTVVVCAPIRSNSKPASQQASKQASKPQPKNPCVVHVKVRMLETQSFEKNAGQTARSALARFRSWYGLNLPQATFSQQTVSTTCTTLRSLFSAAGARWASPNVRSVGLFGCDLRAQALRLGTHVGIPTGAVTAKT